MDVAFLQTVVYIKYLKLKNFSWSMNSALEKLFSYSLSKLFLFTKILKSFLFNRRNASVFEKAGSH